MKFAKAFEDKLSHAVDLVHQVRELTNSCGKHLSAAAKEISSQGHPFVTTAIQFTRINYDAIPCVEHTIKAGNLSETHVLLRWHLELVQLYYYLWKCQSEYRLWLDGKEIRPGTIGKFLENSGMASWKETYIEWSNVTHCNSDYVERCWTISTATPVTHDQILLAGQALRNLMWNAHRINMVSGTLLRDLIDVNLYNPIAEQYNSLDTKIMAYSDKQNKLENEAWHD